jgi:hypothetical protein
MACSGFGHEEGGLDDVRQRGPGEHPRPGPHWVDGRGLGAMVLGRFNVPADFEPPWAEGEALPHPLHHVPAASTGNLLEGPPGRMAFPMAGAF